jgi:ABC-type nitrate/sulfonate/bicarbonate transport system permease component
MRTAQSLIRIDIIIVWLIVLSVMSLIFEKGFALLEKRLTRDWY